MTPIDEALGSVLRTLGDALVNDPLDRDLQGVFEQEVQRVVGLRSFRLREMPARYQPRLAAPTGTAESLLLGVPSSDPRTQATLEAVFIDGYQPTTGDIDLLAAAAQLAGLVLEASRTRAAMTVRSGTDSASLVGSSSVMRILRERVERVAATDFTVLIEGGMSPQ